MELINFPIYCGFTNKVENAQNYKRFMIKYFSIFKTSNPSIYSDYIKNIDDLGVYNGGVSCNLIKILGMQCGYLFDITPLEPKGYIRINFSCDYFNSKNKIRSFILTPELWDKL